MTMRAQARELAADVYREALAGLFGLIERRIEWRRANAPLLALEAEHMVELLEDAPGVVLFRKARIRTWRNRWRRHEARALAAEDARVRALAVECLGRCVEGDD